MDTAEILKHIDGFIREERKMPEHSPGIFGLIVRIAEFLRAYAGEKSLFFQAAKTLSARADGDDLRIEITNHKTRLRDILKQYRNYVAAGLHEGVSPERQGKMDVMSDFLAQAGALLSAKGIHPAGAVMLAGASLEAFLRERAEAEDIRSPKPGIDGYAESLRKSGKIDKQDQKDITAWAGLRNDAAHGKWDKVSNAKQVRIMLDGINLFMRKYGAKTRN